MVPGRLDSLPLCIPAAATTVTAAIAAYSTEASTVASISSTDTTSAAASATIRRARANIPLLHMLALVSERMPTARMASRLAAGLLGAE